METLSGARAATLIASISTLFGLNVYHYVHETSLEHQADDRVHDIQTYNRQLQRQLEAGDRVVANLVLKDGEKTYEFHSVSPLQQQEVCKGDYKITNNQAQIVGNVACTTVEQIGNK